METATVFDWILLAIVVVSCLFGLWRGFLKELISLASWVAAFFVARLFAPKLSYFLTILTDNTTFQLLIAFAVLFTATLVVGALINNVFSNLAQATGLSGTDQLFGMVFGLIRGVMVVVILVSLLSISPVSQDIWWRESQLIPHFLLLEEWFYKLINDPQEINSMLELIQLQK